MRTTSILSGTFSATAFGNSFARRNTLANDPRELIPVQIAFGAGTGGGVTIEGRLLPNLPWRAIVANQTADFHGTMPNYPEVRASVTGTPVARVINVAVGDDRGVVG